eukprot:gb/GECH01013014.1/.p1 GENE.gb/GECH01013014.1/~~gb/GECH01013014.1/.p1  ORF type:complete len:195 (+),score=48.02 gb/GECH01013014.1/:1-585(+)
MAEGQISGFSLSRMLEVMGSVKDEEEVKEIVAEYEVFSGIDEDEDEEESEEGKVFLAEVLLGKPSVQEETTSHILAIIFLSRYQQEHLPVASIVNCVSRMESLVETISSYLSSRSKQLMEYLAVGRPFVGRTMQGEWQMYAYLELDECVELLSEYREIAGKIELEEQDAELFQQLVRWLQTVVEAGKDLFLYIA